MGQCTMLLRTPSPIMSGKSTIYWNLQWNVPPGWVSFFTPLGEGELPNLHWGSVVLLQAGPVETHYTCNGIGTFEREEKVGGPSLVAPPA